MNNSTPNGGVDGHVRIIGDGKPNNLNILQPVGLQAEFGDRFAYRQCDVGQDKSNEGEQNGQENLEEVEEAGSNQAVDHS